VRPASRVDEGQRGNERWNEKERACEGDGRLGFDQRKVGDEVGRGATMLSKARRHSAFPCQQRGRQQRGANRGRFSVDLSTCDRSNSEQGRAAERKSVWVATRADGMHRSALVVAVVSAVTAEFERRSQCHTVGPQRLQGSLVSQDGR